MSWPSARTALAVSPGELGPARTVRPHGPAPSAQGAVGSGSGNSPGPPAPPPPGSATPQPCPAPGRPGLQHTTAEDSCAPPTRARPGEQMWEWAVPSSPPGNRMDFPSRLLRCPLPPPALFTLRQTREQNASGASNTSRSPRPGPACGSPAPSPLLGPRQNSGSRCHAGGEPHTSNARASVSAGSPACTAQTLWLIGSRPPAWPTGPQGRVCPRRVQRGITFSSVPAGRGR